MIRRRGFMGMLAALATLPQGRAAAQAATTLPFDPASVETRARALAQAPYEARPTVPQAWIDLTYDQYRKIWFNTQRAIWAGTDSPFQVDLFHPGLYFPRPVRIHIVEDGESRELKFDYSLFDKTDQAPDLPIDDSLGYSGLRLRAELERQGIFQEFFVLQGASYFRALGRGETYGLSARGLALNTGEAAGEEFPEFVEFWVERPEAGANLIRIHALLDSPSVSGAYHFDVMPGEATRSDVGAVIFPRTDLAHVGLAPLTSMFLFDETNRDRFSDFRSAIHDSDGLLMHNGAGEMLWRPLANPRTLQISAFSDADPRGFGLMQRARALADFADLEANYHKRPGLWIEPDGAWGRGAVALVEIPSDKEIYDNIVAYWRPAEPLPAGGEHRFAYRMTWGQDPVPRGTAVRVLNTRMGRSFNGDGLTIAIDFEPAPELSGEIEDFTWAVRATAGELTPGILQRNPETGGLRLAFDFRPGDAALAEFRAYLMQDGAPISETWLYRWTS